MPGFELWGDEERKEVNDVLETGILMRYGFDGPRKGIWKVERTGSSYLRNIWQQICATYFQRYICTNNSYECIGHWLW